MGRFEPTLFPQLSLALLSKQYARERAKPLLLTGQQFLLLKVVEFAHELSYPVSLIVGEISGFGKYIEPGAPVARSCADAVKHERPHQSTEMRDVLFDERVRLHLLIVLAALLLPS
jgi:hypothetical protein